MMLSWYLLYTKPWNEDKVTYLLSGAGYKLLNPKIRERKFYRRKIAEITSPLFPCYLFVKFDKIRDYHQIRYTRGVKNVLGNDSGPAEVSERIIESITSRIEDGCVVIRRGFRPGETVILKGGPFEGFDAVFEKELNGMERVSVLLKSINLRLVVDSSMLA
ncbi:MAG: hypothetical protein HY954_12675 [Deltaproteobacteria bacterium]|nr:hypothetical protein [Deltaproteobacteria bacterium]